MSALIVIGFKQQHRASEVLNELRQRDWGWVGDLDHAVVVKHNEDDRFRIDLSVDPMTQEDVAWARLWGELLSLVLADPVKHGMVEATEGVTVGPRGSISGAATHDANWWIHELCISRGFIRSAGAIIEPGDSALFMFVHTDDPIAVLKKLKDYGGTLLRTSLSVEQDAKLKNALAGKLKT